MNDLDLCLEMVMSTIALHSTLNISDSETFRARGLVPKGRQQEVAYGPGVSNGHVADDVTWLQKGQTFCDPNTLVDRNISKTSGDAI